MSERSRWAERADLAIAHVLVDVGDADEAEVRQRITAAYPFGPRAHYPYKVWLERSRIWIAVWKDGHHVPLAKATLTRARRQNGEPAQNEELL